MKISHTALSQCQRDPTRWFGLATGEPSPRPPGYASLTRFAIHRYHRTADVATAIAHLRALLERSKERLTSRKRHHEAVENLQDYVDWYDSADVVLGDSKVRIELPSGGLLTLSGEIHRIDVTDSGYRAVLIGTHRDDWFTELRFPLIQHAVARLYQVPVADTEVGVQHLDGSGLDLRNYGVQERSKALAVFAALSRRIESM